jgi:hypothetical protein
MTQEIEQAQQKLQVTRSSNTELVTWAHKLQIIDIITQKSAETLRQEIKCAKKKAKEQLEYLIAPSKETIRRITAIAKPVMYELDAAEPIVDEKLKAWRKSQEHVTEEVINQRATEFHIANEQAKETGEVPPPLPDLAVTPPAPLSRHNMGTTGYKPKKKVTIINRDLVPRPYCDPTMSKLQKAADLGITEIPGCIIVDDYTITSRLAK